MSGKKGQKRKVAKYNHKIAQTVLARLEAGETLTNICKDLKGYAPEQIRGWKRSNSQFKEEYRIAMESGLEALSDKVMDLVTTPVEIDGLSPRDQLLAINNQRRDFINAVHFSVAKGVSRLNTADKAVAIQNSKPQILVQNYSTKEGTETKVITPIEQKVTESETKVVDIVTERDGFLKLERLATTANPTIVLANWEDK